MAMKNYIPSSKSDDTDPGAPGGPSTGHPGGPGSNHPTFSAPMAQEVDDVTNMLVDYNDRFATADPALFRDQVITQCMSTLIGKNKPNPLLVGPAGGGKTKVVEEIARRIAVKDPTVPTALSASTIYELPLSNLVAGAGIVGELEKRLTTLIDFLSDPDNDAIVFIDEIHLLNNDRSTTYEKIGQLLKPAMARGELRLIGATTLTEARSFETDPALKRRLTRIIVEELTPQQTEEILRMARASYQAHYRHEVSVSDDVLHQVVRLADRYGSTTSHRPDGALTLLDRAMASIVVERRQMIAQAQQAGNQAMLNALTSQPVTPLTARKTEQVARRLSTGQARAGSLDLVALRQDMKRIVGQSEPIDQLMDTLAERELNLFSDARPLSWLLAGPSGCGKTETARIVAHHLSDNEPIIINMAEFVSPASINRLIGSPAGYVGSDSNEERPFDVLDSNPHQVIVLDEFEKAHITVQRLFLSALDNGYITDSANQRKDFSKALVVATTNAGRDIGATGTSISPVTQAPTKSTITKALTQQFEPEVLARFTTTVAYAPLDRTTYREIIVQTYQRLREQVVDDDPTLVGSLPQNLQTDQVEDITTRTFEQSQGARPALAAVRSTINQLVLAARHSGVPAATSQSPQIAPADLEAGSQPNTSSVG